MRTDVDAAKQTFCSPPISHAYASTSSSEYKGGFSPMRRLTIVLTVLMMFPLLMEKTAAAHTLNADRLPSMERGGMSPSHVRLWIEPSPVRINHRVLPTCVLARLSCDTMPRSGGSPGLSLKLLPSCLIHSSTHHQYFAAMVTGLRPRESIGFYIHPDTLGLLGVRQANTHGVIDYLIVAPNVGTYIVSVYRIHPRAATATLRVLPQAASCK
jgi:hypothetical protein